MTFHEIFFSFEINESLMKKATKKKRKRKKKKEEEETNGLVIVHIHSIPNFPANFICTDILNNLTTFHVFFLEFDLKCYKKNIMINVLYIFFSKDLDLILFIKNIKLNLNY
jgi:hypothetical protein